ncbi:MAG: hypothetical protein ACW9W4_08610 [Candidatus Nitrosopumilus sp. bin_7KS]
MKTISDKCKCGHGMTLHHLKMESKKGFEYYSSNDKRVNCRQCDCIEYVPIKRKWEFWK